MVGKERGPYELFLSLKRVNKAICRETKEQECSRIGHEAAVGMYKIPESQFTNMPWDSDGNDADVADAEHEYD